MTADVSPLPRADADGARRGFFFALAAYLMWGTLPLYMKVVAHIPATEVLAHRILWSIPVAGIVLVVLGRTADVVAALRSPRTLVLAGITAALISLNWGIYVWAIAVDRAVETSLGYYINPLMSVSMAAVLLGERLTRLQLVSIGLAVVAVSLLTWEAGGLPWVSIALAATFAVYGFLRKTLPIGPSQGFFLEVMIVGVPALAYVVWLQSTGQGHFTTSNPRDMMLLALCGPITAVPLMLYGFGAKLLRFSTISIMQYIGPTIIFVIAVFVFNEPFGAERLVAFVVIWISLVLYTWSMFSASRSPQAMRKKGA